MSTSAVPAGDDLTEATLTKEAQALHSFLAFNQNLLSVGVGAGELILYFKKYSATERSMPMWWNSIPVRHVLTGEITP